jgi:hypothetical protein
MSFLLSFKIFFSGLLKGPQFFRYHETWAIHRLACTQVHSARNFLENEPHVREIQFTTTARNISIVSRVCQFDEEGNQRYPRDVFEVLSIVWGKDCPNQYPCILEP